MALVLLLLAAASLAEGSDFTCADVRNAYREARCCSAADAANRSVSLSCPAPHAFHDGVIYRSLVDAHAKWKQGHFTHVLDVRELGPNGDLEGWRDMHIPGSFPLTVFPGSPAFRQLEEKDCHNLGPLSQSYQGCKDTKVLVNCWSGGTANTVAKFLVQMCNWTDVTAMGHQSSSGIWQWAAAFPEDMVYNDTRNATELVPPCV